jgi:hypothetical protein
MPTPYVQMNDSIALRVQFMDGSAARDISSATTRQIIVRNRNGVPYTFAAAFGGDGTDGVITYTTAVTDINVDGEWQIQGRLVMPSGTLHSEVSNFIAVPNLA